MIPSFATLTRSALEAKRKWYAARPQHADKVAAIDSILNPISLLGGAAVPDMVTDISVEADLADTPSPSNTIVKRIYKQRYAEAGDPRSCGDWLALTLISATNPDREKLDIAMFEAILTENGVKHEHWNRTTPGWQGRLRMTGRMALQKRVVETNTLFLHGVVITPPDAWVFAKGG